MGHRHPVLVALGVLLLTSTFIEHAECELFTAIAHMEGLLGLETELLQSLNSYITAEKQRSVS